MQEIVESRTRILALLALTFAAACGDGLQSAEPIDAGIFIPNDEDPDAAPEPPECDGLAQSGCQQGEKCGVADRQWECQADGYRELHQACIWRDGRDTCKAGMHCYEGVCYAMCGPALSCATGDQCVPFAGSAEALAVCLGSCDAIAQDCPDAGEARQACYIYGASAMCAPMATDTPKFPGQSCSYINDCVVGAGCVNIGGRYQCAAYCDYQTNPDASDPLCGEHDLCRALQGAGSVGVCY